MNEYLCWICAAVTSSVIVFFAWKALFWAIGVCDRFRALERDAARNETHRQEWRPIEKWDLQHCARSVQTLSDKYIDVANDISALKSKRKGGKS